MPPAEPGRRHLVVLALPNIMTGVGLDTDELGRAAPIISVFLLGYVALLPVVGRIADRVGRIPVLTGCLFVFATGSLVTATAHTLPGAIAGRGLQGVGAGGLVPATLALVADLYPPDRRGVPLGVVGAVQEAGAVLGPLLGALILALASWRTIFWVNLVAGLALAGALAIGRDAARPRADPVGVALVGLAGVGFGLVVWAPPRLVDNYTLGPAWTPVAGTDRTLCPLALATLAVAALAVLRSLTVPARLRPVPPVRGGLALARTIDLPGGMLLAVALGCVVLAFAGAEAATRRAVSPAAPELLAAAALAAVMFARREARTRNPIVPLRAFRAPAAWGGLVTSFFVGAALVAVLVEVPVFARVTHHNQLGAALLLLRLLVAVPVGAVLGGFGVRRHGPGRVAGLGAVLIAATLAVMTRWGEFAAGSVAASIELVVAGLGFGLLVAPINVAVLNATEGAIHGVASAAVVVARTIGMLVGLSALTAIGLHRFTTAAAKIRSPLEICPDQPTSCQPYKAAVRAAAIGEVHAVFLGASACAVLAAVLAVGLLGARSPERT